MRFVCWLFGHAWMPYVNFPADAGTYCDRCGKTESLVKRQHHNGSPVREENER